MSTGRVHIYGLADPLTLYAQRDAVTRALIVALQVSLRVDDLVTVSPSSGGISYVDTRELWRRSTPPTLPNRAAARKAAEDFLLRLTRAMSSETSWWPAALRRLVVAPPGLQPTQLAVIARPDGDAYDHWLYRAQPHLRLFRDLPEPRNQDGGRNGMRDRPPSVPVLGTEAVVRVGHEGRIVACQLSWRPLSGEWPPAEFRLYSAEPHDHPPAGRAGHDANALADEAPPLVAYSLDGDGIPQYYLSPYHVVSDEHGHGMEFVSACPLSLVATITQAETRAGTVLTARISGGSGDYQVRWATLALDAVLDVGLQLHEGEAPAQRPGDNAPAGTLRLPRGVYLVLVNVRDRATGAFKHYQQNVFSQPGAERGALAPDSLPQV